MPQYTIHPLAEITPAITYAEMEDMAADIRVNGQREPIELLGDSNAIIDGRHRFKACVMADVEPKFKRVNPPDVYAYVISKNVHRRHLSTSQRAAILAQFELARHYEAEAGPRAAGDHAPPPEPPAAELAAGAGIPERTMRRARRVAREHPAELPRVVSGETSLRAAEVGAPPLHKDTAPARGPRVDSFGVEIPPEALPGWDGAWVEAVGEMRSMLHSIRKVLDSDDIGKSPLGRCIAIPELLTDLNHAIDMLRPKFTKAHCVCPVCSGDAAGGKKKCKGCVNKGWCTAHDYDNNVGAQFKGNGK